MDSPRPKLLPNPSEKMTLLPRIFFVWTISLFRKGYTKVLQLDDIYESLKCDKSETLGERLET